jgi:hypothetical protein
MAIAVSETVGNRNIHAIVEYLLCDEQQHFLECGLSDDFCNQAEVLMGRHIYMDLAPVAAALGYELDPEAVELYNRLVSPSERIK